PGVHVPLHDGIANVTLTGNVFVDGKAAIGLAVKDPKQIKGLTVINNTFFGLKAWLNNEGTFDHTELRFTRNLIMKCPQVWGGTDNNPSGVPGSWFEDNWWVRCDGLNEAQVQIVAAIKEQVPLQSENPTSAYFLHPTNRAMSQAGYVGAIPPPIGE